MNLLAKSLLVVMIFFGISQKDKFMAKAGNYTKEVVVYAELGQIIKLIRIAAIDEDIPEQDEFTHFLQESLDSKVDKDRDTSRDLWGNPYLLERNEDIVKVISTGSDGIVNTEDDLVRSIRL